MIEVFLTSFLLVYAIALWRIHSFSKIDSVPFYWGGWFSPHAFAAQRSGAFIPITIVWYAFFLFVAYSQPLLRASPIGYKFAEALPIFSAIVLSYFMISVIFVLRLCANQDIQISLDNAPKPLILFPEQDYPSCLVATREESELIPLLQHPEISLCISMTPFPGPVREVPTDMLQVVREVAPDIKVQPLHPEIGLDISTHLQQLEDTSTSQAEKALEATRQFSEMTTKISSLEAMIADLQKSNETLNNKILSVRTRARGATADFGQMTRPELDLERDRLMDTLRRLDDERRRKSGK